MHPPSRLCARLATVAIAALIAGSSLTALAANPGSPSVTPVASAPASAASNAPAAPAPAESASPPSGGETGGQTPDGKTQTATINALLAIVIIALCGGIGGVVDGLSTPVSYRLSLVRRVRATVPAGGTATASTPSAPSPAADEIELGWLGDAAVGIVAAFSIFVVSSVAFPGTEAIKLENIDLLRLIGWSLVAGYLGPRILRILAEKTAAAQEAAQQAQKAEQKADEAQQQAQQTLNVADQTRTQGNRAAPLLDQANGLLATNEAAKLVPGADPRERLKLLEGARRNFQLAAKQDAARVNALIGEANACYSMAELALTKDAPALDRAQLWRDGIAALQAALKADPKAAKAHYNLACFQARANEVLPAAERHPVPDILAGLRRACELEPGFADYAKSDPDFQGLREQPGELSAEDLELLGAAAARSASPAPAPATRTSPDPSSEPRVD